MTTCANPGCDLIGTHKCGACKTIFYCCVECQSADWPKHKVECVSKVNVAKETCANPGCDQPGTNQCSACKTTPYCGPICQTAHWAQHKEECPGHLRKIGMANLEKAKGFEQERNCPQILRHSILALAKLQQLKDCPIEDLSNAMRLKFNALNYMGRNSEALECAKEWYCLYPTKHTHPPAIDASFCLIHSCINNNEFADAALYARTLWETINDTSTNNHIPAAQRQPFIARGALELARTTLRLSEHGGLPPGAKQAAGQEAISLGRRALEIHTQLHGRESQEVAGDLGILAQILGGFNDVDDEEITRLLQQAIDIYARVQGKLSPNVAAGENSLANAYLRRANKEHAAHDLERRVANLELAMPHYREAILNYRAANRPADVDRVTRDATKVSELLQKALTIRDAFSAVMGMQRGAEGSNTKKV